MVDQIRNQLPVEPPAMTPTNLLWDVARCALGSELSVVTESSVGASFPGQLLVQSGGAFVDAVEDQLASGSVLAVPAWTQERGPSSPVAGQELMEHVRLSEYPLGLLVPLGSLAGGGAKFDRFREALLRHNRSLLVLEACEVLEGLSPVFNVALVVLHLDRAGDGVLTRFVRVPRNPDPAVVVDELQRLLRMRGGRKTLGFVHSGEVDPYSPLMYQYYDPVLRAKQAELQTWGPGTTLGALFEILVPAGINGRRSSRPPRAHGRFVTGRSIARSGRLELSAGNEAPKTEPLPLEAGDLVMPALFSPVTTGGMRVAEIHEEDLPASALQHVLVLRPRRELPEAERFLLLQYLRSSLARELVVAGGARPTLTPSFLGTLYAPVADGALLEAVGSIAEADRMLRMWGQEATKALDSIFALESPKAAREALIERGRDSRLSLNPPVW